MIGELHVIAARNTTRLSYENFGSQINLGRNDNWHSCGHSLDYCVAEVLCVGRQGPDICIGQGCEALRSKLWPDKKDLLINTAISCQRSEIRSQSLIVGACHNEGDITRRQALYRPNQNIDPLLMRDTPEEKDEPDIFRQFERLSKRTPRRKLAKRWEVNSVAHNVVRHIWGHHV